MLLSNDIPAAPAGKTRWPWKRLDAVADIGAGDPAPQGDENFSDDGRPFVRVFDLGRLGNQKIINNTRDRVSATCGSRLRMFRKGTVLFTKSGASTLLNQRAILGDDMHVVSHVGTAIPGNGVTSEWLYYWLLTVDFKKFSQATTLPSLPLAKVKAIPIPVPPIEEQRRIVAEIEERLSRIEAGIAALKRVQANLKRYRAAALHSVFTGGLAGNDLPAGWRWTTLGEQFRIGVGATPSRKEPAYWGGSIPWVSSGEVQFCRVRETSEHITDQGLSNSSTRINPRGSVLLAMIGQGRTRGQAAILEIEAANNQNCAAIWVGETNTPPEFVYYWLMSEYEATRQVGSGNNQQALNKSLVQALPIPWPPLTEQHNIVTEIERRLSVVEELETQVQADLARAERLRASVLSMAFQWH